MTPLTSTSDSAFRILLCSCLGYWRLGSPEFSISVGSDDQQINWHTIFGTIALIVILHVISYASNATQSQQTCH